MGLMMLFVGCCAWCSNRRTRQLVYQNKRDTIEYWVLSLGRGVEIFMDLAPVRTRTPIKRMGDTAAKYGPERRCRAWRTRGWTENRYEATAVQRHTGSFCITREHNSAARHEEQVFFSVGTPHTSASRKRQHAQDALTSHRSSRARYSSAVLAIVRLQPVFLASRESGLGATARPSREL